MSRAFWPVALGSAVLTLLSLQPMTAYGQYRQGCRWWSRGYVTVWYGPAPASPTVMATAKEAPGYYKAFAEPLPNSESRPIPAAIARKPIIERLSDGSNLNFRGVVAWK